MSLLELFCEIDDFCQVYEAIYRQQELASDEHLCQRSTDHQPFHVLLIKSGNFTLPRWHPTGVAVM